MSGGGRDRPPPNSFCSLPLSLKLWELLKSCQHLPPAGSGTEEFFTRPSLEPPWVHFYFAAHAWGILASNPERV